VWKYEVNQIKSTERLDAGACRVSFTWLHHHAIELSPLAPITF
jgi:hypothetical protein